ncbi:hypothetical protein [Ammoniphilus sp. CFH 90114]|uniref:hypothetical protein n=1 Tax=Ammoniphilus sp. CFH 90114 TaxID=2493665 RepID=UPI00100F6FD0|nr:hypothetical protein [Ammoniphilus sp. CFH 90114]RXT05842.1 hypothetical protein EIZ39_17220 [Ammoniphilus sp. CFH 90114]
MENMSFTIHDITRDVGVSISGPAQHPCGADLYLKAILALIEQADLSAMAEDGYRDFGFQFHVAILKQLVNRTFMDTLDRIPDDLDYAEALIHDIHHYREEGLI